MFRFKFRRHRTPKTYHVSSPDGTTLTFELEGRVTGQELLTRTLEESRASGDSDYFGLASYEGSFVKWIIVNKPLKKQLSGKGPFQLHLRVQVYPMDYHSLSQPASRQLLAMQLRRDLLENRFTCEEDKLVWLLGLTVQAELGDYNSATCVAGYLSHVELMPRLTGSLEQQIQTHHLMNRGKPPAACQEELLGGAQLEASYGIISYQVQDASRNPVTMTAAPSGIRVLRGMMATNHYHWHTIIKMSHRGRRLYFNISSQTPDAGHAQFTCSSSSMAGNMVYHLSRLRDNYTSAHTQRPSRLQRFFSSRRSVRVLKPLSRPHDAPSSNPLQRRSFAGEAPDPSLFNHTSPSQGMIFSRPHRSSLTIPSTPSPLPDVTMHKVNTPLEADVRQSAHTHSESYSSRHSGVVESHVRQESGLSRHSHHSTLVDPLPPVDHIIHPRQGSVISQHSHRSSPSRLSQEHMVVTPPSNNTPYHHGNNYMETHSTPIKAHSYNKEEWQLRSPPRSGYGSSSFSGHRGSPYGRENIHRGGPCDDRRSSHNVPQGNWASEDQPGHLWRREEWKEVEPTSIIPEEEGDQQFYQSHHRTPPRFLTQPELQLQPSKSSTFPREGSLSQPEGNMESVVDLLDEALEVLDEEEDQRKERERQRAQKPWKPQHRGRFRLSLQDSSYYDYRLYNSYRHFNRNRAFHGSKQSSSTTHLNTANTANDPSIDNVASAQLQESLVELSQTSETAIDPHIRSFVFEGSHTESGGATEL